MLLVDSHLDKPINYKEGALILVDKELDWTSFDVVNKLRYTLKRHYGTKKFKVGHAGTLDPLATGLLLVCTGKYTKRIEEIQGLDKTYVGTIKLGAVTRSYDSEFEEEEVKDVDHLSEEVVKKTMISFLGLQQQKPPIFSALKVKGKKLYQYARKGQEVDIKLREVHFRDIEVLNVRLPYVDFSLTCSKGTYIRSFAHDVGQKLGVGGYLNSLRRSAIGDFKVDNALIPAEWLVKFNTYQDVDNSQ